MRSVIAKTFGCAVSMKHQPPRLSISMSSITTSTARFHTQSPVLLPSSRETKTMRKIKASSKKAGSIIEDTTDTSSKLKNLDRMIQRKKFVLDHFDVPSKFQKFFTGRLRNRESNRMQRQLEYGKSNNGRKPEPKNDDVIRVNAREVAGDDDNQHRKIHLLRRNILRILENHLSSGLLPAHHLSMQNWEITDVTLEWLIKEATEHFNNVVNYELEKGVARGIGIRNKIQLQFSNGEVMDKLLDGMKSEIQMHERRSEQKAQTGK
ncbi:hypothetical protein EV177_000723 [Coemansia sp. RSA 1804]|nr:hypothetical protein EV177_000723 [Coemansia sp. RSA 1804]